MDHIPPSGQRSLRVPALVIGLMAAAGVVAVTVWTLAPGASNASGTGGPHLSIAVVPPVEPVPMAGEVLEVGTLNDAFDRAALERQPLSIEAEYLPPDAYAGEAWTETQRVDQPQFERPAAASSGLAVVTSTDPLADGSGLFGFDRRPSEPAAVASATEDMALHTDAATASQSFFQ